MESKVAAAVLCGGRGEKLRPLTDFFQKTMIPLGEHRRPLVEHIVRLLAIQGARDIASVGLCIPKVVAAHWPNELEDCSAVALGEKKFRLDRAHRGGATAEGRIAPNLAELTFRAFRPAAY